MSFHTLSAPARLAPFYSLQLALLGAWRGARRAWAIGRQRQRDARRHHESLRELYEMNDQMLADIGLSRGDFPWYSQRDAFARLLDDQAAYRRAFGGGRLAVDDRR